MKIYKQKLNLMPEQVVDLPMYQDERRKIRILQFQAQDEKPCIWFLTNCEETKKVKVFLCMTGEELSDTQYSSNKYIGTCVLKSGIVLHAFISEV